VLLGASDLPEAEVVLVTGGHLSVPLPAQAQRVMSVAWRK
jgi:hypothetical protein